LEEFSVIVKSIPAANKNLRKRIQSLSFKFLSEALEYSIFKFKGQDLVYLLEYYLLLLSTLSENLIDGLNDCDVRIFEIWAFFVYFNHDIGIFDQLEYFDGLKALLKITPCFHATLLLPRKRSLLKFLSTNPQKLQKFDIFLIDICKYILDDSRGYIVSSLDADERFFLVMIFQQQYLKFQFSLDDNLASYFYAFYTKPAGNILFDIAFKVLQKVKCSSRECLILMVLGFASHS
jgi:hypothetical protein